MSMRVTCREAGHDCDFSVQSENMKELVEMVQMHALNTHAMQVSSSDVRGMAVEA
ncbi:DUF1059 domain-containing protein [Halogeometricum limi]|uniref:Small metal-binding protein n=1 Tax=Halogeometricum limi TaxID=555875 RepID=A0A1I6I419_9EURY|nr:DUF1059 domain-containing protein [Halogeometricum limi]SFR61451.1 Protein of unknown function [Halogeometricum limi]